MPTFIRIVSQVCNMLPTIFTDLLIFIIVGNMEIIIGRYVLGTLLGKYVHFLGMKVECTRIFIQVFTSYEKRLGKCVSQESHLPTYIYFSL